MILSLVRYDKLLLSINQSSYPVLDERACLRSVYFNLLLIERNAQMCLYEMVLQMHKQLKN